LGDPDFRRKVPMKIQLHEVELFSKDAQASQKFYKDVLGLEVHHQMDGLNVFDSGWPGIDFDTSVHNPGRARIGFVVDSLKEFLASVEGKGLKFSGPMKSHLGMNVIRMEDPDGNIVEVQEFTDETPGFLKGAFRE
jgi:catechol 2,3-dioxygenase-like lactoylglutathione lyase family enzyme